MIETVELTDTAEKSPLTFKANTIEKAYLKKLEKLHGVKGLKQLINLFILNPEVKNLTDLKKKEVELSLGF